MSEIRNARRAAIAHAACMEFGAHGYDGANIADIAKRAGIGKSTIYEYYPSKEALLGASAEWALEMSATRIYAVLDKDLDFHSIVHEYLQVMRELMCHTGGCIAMLHSDNRVFSIVRTYARRFRNDIISHLEKAVIRAQQKQEISQDIDAYAAASLIAVLSRPILSADNTDWEASIHRMEDVLFHGLQPRP